MSEGVLIIIQFAALGGVITAAILAFRKAQPESEKVMAESDLIRTEAQSKIIDDLQDEIDRYQNNMIEMEQRFKDQILSLQQQHANEKKMLRDEVQEIRTLNLSHQQRIASLEQRLENV